VSFLKSIRKVFHTTPILRDVSKGFAEAWGMGSTYAQFDQEIGYGKGSGGAGMDGNIAADVLLSRLPLPRYDQDDAELTDDEYYDKYGEYP
jgi:hypothetical protein